MKRVEPHASWPESWRYSYKYDLLEVYGDKSDPAYSLAYAARTRLVLDLIASICPPPASVLDVAAGQGNLSLTLAELGYHVTWNDIRSELAGYVALKHERGAIDLRPGNILDLHFGRSFDVVVLAEVIEHVAHPDQLLRRARSLVAPGGRVVMTTPNGAYFRNALPKFSECPDPSQFESAQFQPDADGHIFLLHPDELHGLGRDAGLRVETLCLFTNPLTTGHLRTRGLLRRLPEQIVWALERSSQRLPMPLRRKMSVQLAVVLTPDDAQVPPDGEGHHNSL